MSILRWVTDMRVKIENPSNETIAKSNDVDMVKLAFDGVEILWTRGQSGSLNGILYTQVYSRRMTDKIVGGSRASSRLRSYGSVGGYGSDKGSVGPRSTSRGRSGSRTWGQCNSSSLGPRSRSRQSGSTLSTSGDGSRVRALGHSYHGSREGSYSPTLVGSSPGRNYSRGGNENGVWGGFSD